MSLVISLIGILVALGLLTYLCFKGFNSLLAAMLSVVIIALSSQLNVVELMTGEYASGLTGFICSNLFLFVMCAVFGKFMEQCGASLAVSQVFSKLFGDRYAIYGIMLATAALTYGGVSIFVIVFTVYPMYLYAFQKANMPRKLIPAAIAASGTSFACNMLPGSPQISNMLPAQLLGTSPTAASALSLICCAICITLLIVFFEWQFRKCRANGEGFVATPEIQAKIDTYLNAPQIKHAWVAFIPMIVFLVVLNVFKANILVAGSAGILATCILFPKTIGGVMGFSNLFNDGFEQAKMAMFNTGAIVAVATVIKLTDGFQYFTDLLSHMNGSPYITFSVATVAVAAMTGSGSGGVSVAISLFADDFIAQGCNPVLLHRIGSLACDIFDNTPHNGFIVTTLTVCGLTHKESYKYICVVSSLIPLLITIFAIIVGPLMY